MEEEHIASSGMKDMSSTHEFQPYRRLEFETSDIMNIYDSVEPLSMIEDNKEDEINETGEDILQKQLIPEVGLKFDTELAAYQFYQNYAKSIGFGTRISSAHKDKISKIILDRVFCCSREGTRPKDKRNAIVKSHRAETRCNCNARMKISCRQDGKYRVVQFVANHNHELATPSKTHLFRSYRKITTTQESEVDAIKDCGIPPKQIIDIMSKQVGGRENLGFIRDDLKNYLRSKKSIAMKQGDTGGVLEFLQMMQLEDPNFFYAIQVDEDDLITNIFWADAKMRTDFIRFGDVVCFDTTYRKHRDGRPIALFVGVNHHKQTTVFGAALLYDETVKTFEWLFETFSTAMMGKVPSTILTDQDGRMASALSSKWPTTYHRLCIRHIYQNAAIHLSDVFSSFKDFAIDFSKCIYDYEEVDDFFEAWQQMLEKYNLEDNKWLKKMFDIKEKWSLVYGRDTFCADMTTTQRSETMNSVLKRYVNYKNDLLEFFGHFQRLLNDRRYEECRADFMCSQSTPALPFPIQLLKHAASIYTYEIFEQFKVELCKGIDCIIKSDEDAGTQKIYKILSQDKRHHHFVRYDLANDFISCSCKKIEFAGILCSHALKVFTTLSVTRIPDEFILKRWTKAAKTGFMKVSMENTDKIEEKEKLRMRYKELSFLYMQLVTKAAESEEAYIMAKEECYKMLGKMDETAKKSKKVNEHSLSLVVDNVNQDVSSNQGEIGGSVIKGVKVKEKVTYKNSKRPKNALEKAIRKRKGKAKEKLPVKITQDCDITNCDSNMVTSSLVQNLHRQPLQVPQFTTTNVEAWHNIRDTSKDQPFDCEEDCIRPNINK